MISVKNYLIILCFSLVCNTYAQKSTDNAHKYNGIYQTVKDGKKFSLKSDSTTVFEIDTVGFVSLNSFKNVELSFDNSGYPTLLMTLNDLGKKRFSVLTSKNIGKPLALIVNNNLYSAPVVHANIPDGNFEISGLDSFEEIRKLKRLIEVIQLRTAKEKID